MPRLSPIEPERSQDGKATAAPPGEYKKLCDRPYAKVEIPGMHFGFTDHWIRIASPALLSTLMSQEVVPGGWRDFIGLAKTSWYESLAYKVRRNLTTHCTAPGKACLLKLSST